jgi:hypothetical protein
MAKIVDIIMDGVTFPADFTGDDAEKFGNEVASEVGKFLPKGENTEDLIDDVTASSRSITVKLGKQVTKAEKGEKLQFTFRLAVYLQVMAARRVAKVTGFRAFSVDLTTAKFWENWKRAEAPAAETPAEAPAS